MKCKGSPTEGLKVTTRWRPSHRRLITPDVPYCIPPLPYCIPPLPYCIHHWPHCTTPLSSSCSPALPPLAGRPWHVQNFFPFSLMEERWMIWEEKFPGSYLSVILINSNYTTLDIFLLIFHRDLFDSIAIWGLLPDITPYCTALKSIV